MKKSKKQPKWTEGKVVQWREHPKILQQGAWNWLEGVSNRTDFAPIERELQRLSIFIDKGWWFSAQEELKDHHGEEAFKEFWAPFNDDDALRHRAVAIYGAEKIRRGFAGEIFGMIDMTARDVVSSGLPEQERLRQVAPRLGVWLYNVVKKHEFRELEILAELTRDSINEPDIAFATNSPPDLHTSKALMLKSVLAHLESHRALPSKRALASAEGRSHEDSAFRRDLRELGLNGLPTK